MSTLYMGASEETVAKYVLFSGRSMESRSCKKGIWITQKKLHS